LSLNTEERQLWLVTVESLPVGLLTAADNNALERYAIVWARWRACQREIAKGNLNSQANVTWLKIQREASSEMSKLITELGLSPLARTRLSTDGKEEVDPLELLLDGRKDDQAYRVALGS
jgi:P27 family predicted phage terminase small subunit